MKTPFGKSATGLRLERMKASPRWVDGAFRNLHPIQPRLKTGVPMPPIREFLCGGERRRPAAALPSIDPRDSWAKRAESGLRATWLGHSTVLVEIDGFRVLTDPVWGERASPVKIAGPRRFQPIPVPLAALPPLDLVIISHDHYDHLDYPTIRELTRSEVPFVTSLGVGAHLESWGISAARITELDWWESMELGELTISAAPSQHFSGRGVGGRNSTLWSSFVVQGRKNSVFFSGDTGLTSEYSDIRARLGPFDLVMLEVGAFHPAWGDIHLGPDYALEALALLGGGRFLPVHWGTFDLALHAWDQPAERLIELAPRQGVELMMPRLGEPIEPSRPAKLEAWWRPIAALEKKEPTPREVGEEPPPGSEALEWPID